MYSQASIPGEGMFPDQIDPRINGAPADFAEIIRNT